MRIWVIGAFSTGKTTLIESIWKELKGYKIITNTEREIADLLWFDFNNHTELELLKYQSVASQKIIDEAITKNMITDTPIHLLQAYCEKPFTKNIVKRYWWIYDLLFYLPPEIDIEDDWIRHIDKKYQNQIDRNIKKILRHYEHITLTGSIEQRTKLWLEIILNLNK